MLSIEKTKKSPRTQTMSELRRLLNRMDPEMAMEAVEELNHLENRVETLQRLLKEQLKVSGKCCYAKAPNYAGIRSELVSLGYGPDIISETIGKGEFDE
jgi:anion-transporting  ArsA/GET3 family ATPase